MRRRVASRSLLVRLAGARAGQAVTTSTHRGAAALPPRPGGHARRAASTSRRRSSRPPCALDPTLELAHYGLGQVYMATKRFRAAIARLPRLPRRVQCQHRAPTPTTTIDGAAAARRRDPGRSKMSRRCSVPAANRDDVRRRAIDLRSTTQIADLKARRIRDAKSAPSRCRPGSRSRSAAPTSAATRWPTPSANTARRSRSIRSSAKPTTTSPSSTC